MIQFLKNIVLTVETAFWDRWLRINTLGIRPGEVPTGSVNGDSLYNQSKCYATIRACLRHEKLTAQDVFYDVGCGAGRDLCIVAQSRIRKCVGLELSETLCRLAGNNALRLRGRRTPIQIIQGDACLADFSAGTVFFFYNPFGSKSLESVLCRIRENVIREPRPIRCIYLNPVCHRVFEDQKWLQETAKRTVGRGGLAARYYSSVATPLVRRQQVNKMPQRIQ